MFKSSLNTPIETTQKVSQSAPKRAKNTPQKHPKSVQKCPKKCQKHPSKNTQKVTKSDQKCTKTLTKKYQKVTKNVYKVIKNTQKTAMRIARNLTAVRQFLRQTTGGAPTHPAFPPSSRGLTARERAHRQVNLAGKQGERRSVYVNYCFSSRVAIPSFGAVVVVTRRMCSALQNW